MTIHRIMIWIPLNTLSQTSLSSSFFIVVPPVVGAALAYRVSAPRYALHHAFSPGLLVDKYKLAIYILRADANLLLIIL